jgi:hypothetical protein
VRLSELASMGLGGWLPMSGKLGHLLQCGRRGHLQLLQWARAIGCPWNDATCSTAAWGGHLEMVQWARENGCEWDQYTCTNAAANGHLDVLKWARGQGCPWDVFS